MVPGVGVWYLVWVCGTWYGCVGVWVCVLWWDDRCDGLKKTSEKLFQLNFPLTDRSSRKSQVFRLDPQVGKLSRKKLSQKSPLSTV